ncbi:unnamed protein product [Amoebophrya sp. A120]|nr:unnamed protein product [Amoebophrya sp. A120]|eukprot:GSA120T00001175001.1
MSDDASGAAPAGGGGASVEIDEKADDGVAKSQYRVARIPPQYEAALPSLEYKLKTIDHFDECFELATAEYKDPGTGQIRLVKIKRCKFGPLSPWIPIANKNDIKLKDRIRFVPKKSAKEMQEDKSAARAQQVQDKLDSVLQSDSAKETRWKYLEEVKERDLEEYYRSDRIEVFLRDQRLEFCMRIYEEVDFWSHLRMPFKLPRLFDVIVPTDKTSKNDRLDIVEAFLVYDLPRRLSQAELFHFMYHMHRQKFAFAKHFSSFVNSVYLNPMTVVPTWNLSCYNFELEKRQQERAAKDRIGGLGGGGATASANSAGGITERQSSREQQQAVKGKVPGKEKQAVKKKSSTGLLNSSGKLTRTPALEQSDDGGASGSTSSGIKSGGTSKHGEPVTTEYQQRRYALEQKRAAANLQLLNKKIRPKHPCCSAMHPDDRFLSPEQVVGGELSDKSDVFAGALCIAADKLNRVKDSDVSLEERKAAEVPICSGLEPPVERLCIGAGIAMFYDEKARKQMEDAASKKKKGKKFVDLDDDEENGEKKHTSKKNGGTRKSANSKAGTTTDSSLSGGKQLQGAGNGTTTTSSVGAEVDEQTTGGMKKDATEVGVVDDHGGEVVSSAADQEGSTRTATGGGDEKLTATEHEQQGESSAPQQGGDTDSVKRASSTLDTVEEESERARLEAVRGMDNQYGVIVPLAQEVHQRSTSPTSKVPDKFEEIKKEEKRKQQEKEEKKKASSAGSASSSAGAKTDTATDVGGGSTNKQQNKDKEKGSSSSAGGANKLSSSSSSSTANLQRQNSSAKPFYTAEQQKSLEKMKQYFWKYYEPLEWEDILTNNAVWDALSDPRLENCFNLDPRARPTALEMIKRFDQKYDPDIEEKVRCENRGIDFHSSDLDDKDLPLELAQRMENEWEREKYSDAVNFRFHFLRLAQRFHADYYVPPIEEFDERWRSQFE